LGEEVCRHGVRICLVKTLPKKCRGLHVSRGTEEPDTERQMPRISTLPLHPGAMKRTLTVILASDVAGYSRLIGEAEEETITRFNEAARIFADLVHKNDGRIFNTAGDAILAEFGSAVSATRCAIDIQQANHSLNVGLAESRRLLFRIGIALGDVVVTEKGDLLGDGVNIAARLQALAEPGGICISQDVRNHVASNISLTFVDMGDQSLKNIRQPVRAFRVVPGGQGTTQGTRKIGFASARSKLLLSGGGAALILAGALLLVGLPRQWIAHTPATSVQQFDAAVIPLVAEGVRRELADYPKRPDAKALAISAESFFVSDRATDLATAKREALEGCRLRSRQTICRLYAAGTDVVWSSEWVPLPSPDDVRAELMDSSPVAAGAVVLGYAISAGYATGPDHKAIAISGAGGGWYALQRSSRIEAARQALERCGYAYEHPCMLLSVDGFFTVEIPKSRPIIGIFMPGTDADLPVEARQQVGQIYQGQEWRALARGKGGSWHAVAGASSEAEAVEAALKSCAAEDRDCQVHAIGNFRVDDTSAGGSRR
jgi:class 3 adenylate cyclase